MVVNAWAMPGIKSELRVHVKHLEARELIDITCSYFDYPYEILRKKSRKKEHVYARDWCMYLLTEYTILSLKQIGDYFNRDHSSVIHARDKVKCNLLDNKYTMHEKYLRDYGKILVKLEYGNFSKRLIKE
jgi:chromosomal replication initiation ATPase DnaA